MSYVSPNELLLHVSDMIDYDTLCSVWSVAELTTVPNYAPFVSRLNIIKGTTDVLHRRQHPCQNVMSLKILEERRITVVIFDMMLKLLRSP